MMRCWTAFGGGAHSCRLDELAAGTDSLAQGALVLHNGLAELSVNSENLVAGSAQMFETLLAQASEQMARAGLDVPARPLKL